MNLIITNFLYLIDAEILLSPNSLILRCVHRLMVSMCCHLLQLDGDVVSGTANSACLRDLHFHSATVI